MTDRSAHLTENLPRLLTGDATRAEVLAAAAHLRNCPDCQQELVSAVVAHASLSSAQRFARDVVAPEPTDDAEVSAGPLPDLSAVFAKARAEAAAGRAPARPRRRLALGAVAAAVVLAGGGVLAAETLGSSGPAGQQAARVVTLQPVGDVRAVAKATIANGTMRVDASALPALPASRQYEVWLADGTGHQLRPVGYVGEDRTAALPVPASVMAKYAYIAISVQKTDQVQFSGDMVARGYYG
jgi:hypothetical protein